MWQNRNMKKFSGENEFSSVRRLVQKWQSCVVPTKFLKSNPVILFFHTGLINKTSIENEEEREKLCWKPKENLD